MEKSEWNLIILNIAHGMGVLPEIVKVIFLQEMKRHWSHSDFSSNGTRCLVMSTEL